MDSNIPSEVVVTGSLVRVVDPADSVSAPSNREWWLAYLADNHRQVAAEGVGKLPPKREARKFDALAFANCSWTLSGCTCSSCVRTLAVRKKASR